MLTEKSYFPGIFEVCWWAASTRATQADQRPRAAVARLVAVFWMFASVVFIAYFTAAVTSNLTLQQLRSDINDAKDLPGKRVASVQGSTASEYLRQQSIEARDYTKIEDAYPALQDGQLDAVVYDAPVLLYFASHEGKGRSKPSVRSFAKKTTASLFRIKARYANGSTRHCSS